jgi:hypothetical protein
MGKKKYNAEDSRYMDAWVSIPRFHETHDSRVKRFEEEKILKHRFKLLLWAKKQKKSRGNKKIDSLVEK